MLAIQTPFACAQSPGMTGGAGWSDALPYYNRGNRYMNQGRYEDALKDYQEAVSKCDTDSDFFVNLGTAYEKCSDFANAQKAFEKAISLNKEDWSAYNNLANSLTKQDKLAEAVKAFEDALKRKPPASDAEAIKKDISDIKKIMEAKGISTTSSSKPASAVKPQVTRAASANKTTAGTKPVTPLKPARAAEIDANIPVQAKPGVTKSSDWGY